MRRTPALLLAALVAACGREPTGIGGGGVIQLDLPLAHQVSAGTDAVTSVTLTLYAINPSAANANDRKREIRTFRYTRDPVTGAWSPRGVTDPGTSTQPLTITIEFPVAENTTYQVEGSALNANGVVLFKVEPVTFTDRQATGAGATVNTSVTYVGPGATAASITLTPSTARLSPGQTQPYQTVVRDGSGAVIANAPVVFSSSNPAVAFFADARVGVITAANTAGTVTVTARIEGLSISGTAQVTVAITPTTLVLVSGGGQSAPVGAQLANPITVRLLAGTQPVPGTAVTFSAPGGTLSASSATTDANGLAAIRWTLGATAGTQTLTVSSAGVPNLAVTATATPLARIVQFVSAVPSAVTTGQTSAITAQVRDASGANISGENVTFTVSTGGTILPSIVTTNAQGLATATFSAANAGTYTITLSIAGGSTAQGTIVVAAQNNSNLATQLVKISGDNQTIRAGQASAQPIVVEARNATGQPVAGAFVDFFGNSGATRLVTGSDGRASATLVAVANATPGPGTVPVQLFPNTSVSVVFSFTIVP
jgi:ribosomal protein L35AE/L33A